MTLAERAELYRKAFPKFQPLSVVETADGKQRLEGLWIMGQNYTVKSGYYGGYPHGYLDRVINQSPGQRDFHFPEKQGHQMSEHPIIIGLCGYAGVGKDSAAANMPGWKRYAFADALKHDLMPLLEMVGCNLAKPEHKAMARPLLVAWGATARKFSPGFWIFRVTNELFENRQAGIKTVVSDVRYPNEVQAILDLGGQVVRIFRNGYGPANDEEANSIREIDAKFCLPAVSNDRTPKELGQNVLKIAGLSHEK